jgi:hypothetical protein
MSNKTINQLEKPVQWLLEDKRVTGRWNATTLGRWAKKVMSIKL